MCRWKVLGQGQNHEALVYLHGFNCGLMDACKGLAQFLALANLPPHVCPGCSVLGSKGCLHCR